MAAATLDARRNVEHRRAGAAPIFSIARVEAGRMLRHPAFVLGLLVVAVAIASVPEDWVDGQFVALTQAAVLAMGLGTLVAAALVAGRERFLSEPDLFPGTPVTPGEHVLGTVLGLVGPALAAAAVAVVKACAALLRTGSCVARRAFPDRSLPLSANGCSPCSWWCWPASPG